VRPQDGQVQEARDAEGEERGTDPTEEMKRPAGEFEEEEHREQIRNLGHDLRGTVLRGPVPAVMVSDRHLGHPEAQLRGDQWNEPVHSAVQAQFSRDLRLVQLQAAVHILEV